MNTPAQKEHTVILILPTIHHVLRAEKLLKKNGLPFDLIPVPKEVNPDCGMAVETGPETVGPVAGALVKAGLEIEALFRRRGDRFTRMSLE